MSGKRKLVWCEFYKTGNYSASHRGKFIRIAKLKGNTWNLEASVSVPFATLVRIIQAAERHAAAVRP